MWITNQELSNKIKSLEKKLESLQQAKTPDYWGYEWQTWYDKSNEEMKVWDGQQYTPIWWNAYWIIDTSDTSLEIVWKYYRLSVFSSPDWRIFSIWIDWMTQWFNIGYFNNTPLAYSVLETKLSDWLWEDYTVEYVSPYYYDINRADKWAMTYTAINTAKNIEWDGFSWARSFDITIDWEVYSINSTDHPDASEELQSQLITEWSYYADDNGNNIDFVRKDWVAMTISIVTNWPTWTATLGTSTWEMTLTFANTDNDYFIPVDQKINKIKISALSQYWNSEWSWENWTQSCIYKYSSTTQVVANRIFQTLTTNYWHIVRVESWWFVITWTVTVSNKLSYICT